MNKISILKLNCCLLPVQKKHRGPYLFGKLLACFEIEVSSQTSKKTNNELTSLCHCTEM